MLDQHFTRLASDAATEQSGAGMKLLKKVQWLALILLLSVLAACAGVSQTLTNRAYHSLNFRPGTESPGIDLLAFRYGSSNHFGFRTPAADIAQGKTSAGAAISGDLPVGDDFYAKWRDKNTGQIYEDTVDLRSRVPYSMHKQELHPIIDGSQLYVYLISFDPIRPYFTQSEVDRIDSYAKTRRERVLAGFARNRVTQIYPTRQEDPHLPTSLKK